MSRGAATTDAAALSQAMACKERTKSELAVRGFRAHLVVLGVEIGGRWLLETQDFLSGRVQLRKRGACQPVSQSRATAVWRRGWTWDLHVTTHVATKRAPGARAARRPSSRTVCTTETWPFWFFNLSLNSEFCSRPPTQDQRAAPVRV